MIGIDNKQSVKDSSDTSENIYRILFEKVNDPMLLLKNGRFIDCNAATLKLLAYPTKSDFLNQRPGDISPAFQADGRSSEEKAEEMIAIAVQTGFHCFEWHHQRHDGLTVAVEVMLTPVIMNDELILYAVWRDLTERIKAYEELRRSETKLRTLYDSTSDAVILLNEQGLFDCNKAALAMFGCTDQKHFCSLHLADLSPAKQPCGKNSTELANRYIMITMAKGSYRFEWMHKRVDTGQSFPAEILLCAMKIDGSPVIQGVVRDITKRKQSENALRESEFRWKFAIEGSGDGVWDWNIQTDEAKYSKRWKEMLGYTEDDILPTNDEWITRIHPDDRLTVAETMQAYLSRKTDVYVVEYRLRCKDNSYKWILGRGMIVSYDADGKPLRMIGTHTDITERKQMEKQVRQLAFYDPLTKLANRLLLRDRLTQAISAGKRTYCHIAVMFIDLDNFKPLNDNHGHVIGDLLLIEVASRLESCVRKHDTVARFGGDEFVVMLNELDVDKSKSVLQTTIVAEKIRNILSKPYRLTVSHHGQSDITVAHDCTASIGVALINHEGNQDDIMEWADAAMYEAKEAGRNSIRFYN
ncbi:bifunctional diguanylate cyclase/phosphodiesterase [Methylobacter sp. S3L5C]|uniref:sensor domain-containing protein n=1 Tax=Methylobacter sp. S3L5C TaxID=2839024 RepID=UPI002059DBBB|nr:diguanylate cyclase [Methylobacter sp. S3L5C]UOA07667.1 diguanylate cyclase [Methylobacter sp. S3L5C]